MNNRFLAAIAVLAASMALGGCELQKSSNPLSPTVAGPIPGVEITPPGILQPATGSRIAVAQQPITLTVENASTNGVRPLSYLFEVATDAGFTNKVFTREGIQPGDGRTSLKLPNPLATDRTYYWHARAQDGANTGPFTSAINFAIYTPIVIGVPQLLWPTPNVTVSVLRPNFTLGNATRSGPVGAITYAIEVADSASFANKVASWTVPEQPTQTLSKSSVDLTAGTTYYWHARAYDPHTTGAWSGVLAFKTPAAAVVVPPPSSPPSSPPPAGGVPAANDAFNLFQAVVEGSSPSNVASRPVTARMTRLSFTSAGVRVDFTKRDGAGRWPDVVPPGWSGPLQYTLWLALKVSGVWHTAGIIQFWNGLDRNGGDVTNATLSCSAGTGQIPCNWTYYIPSMRHQPATGEQVGFFVTAGNQRMGDAALVRERSNVVVIPFPAAGGGSYAF